MKGGFLTLKEEFTEISDTENELIDLLYSLGLEQADIVIVILSLDTEENLKIMLDWLKDKPEELSEDREERVEQIIAKYHEILGEEY